MIFKRFFFVVCIVLLTVFLFKRFPISREKDITSGEAPLSGKVNCIACIDFIETDNYANRQLKFFLYIPEDVLKNKEEEHPLLVCVPGLSGNGKAFAGQVFRDFAKKEGFVIIAPSFIWDKDNWEEKKSYQYPSVWSGYALINIIDKVSYEYGINLHGYYLFGHSAGAQFVLRFAILQSFLCVACAEYGSGGFVTPDGFNNVSFLLGIGEGDTKRIDQAEKFYNVAKDLGIDVELRRYGGGHGLNKDFVRDALDFFKQIKDPNPY